ncbi:uncharacterized protein LOC143201116 [Rhynchophorus ferrugineus]|uniref:uncharacterized protein LOC143201116 n=1 Tax=Rhynchophorus ferrugineus TaxID=354439 RepID=UPI003FCCC6BE
MDNWTVSRRSSVLEYKDFNFSSKYHLEEQVDGPMWSIYILLTVQLCGCVVNLIEHLTLWRYDKKGVYLILHQVSLIDILLFFVGVFETFMSLDKSWSFSNQMCMFYNSSNVFFNAIILYMLVSFNLHIITYCNLHQYELKKNNKNPLTNFSDGSSNECLVGRPEGRSLTIDYRKKQSDISVIFPLIFVWTICASMSLPSLLFSSTVEKQGTMLCVIVENVYAQALHLLLVMFAFVIPCSLLIFSLFILSSKLCKPSENDIDNILHIKFYEIRRLVKLSIVISVLYMLTSFQRHIFECIQIFNNYFIKNNSYYNNYFNTYQLILHYSGSTFRGIICFYILPNLRKRAKNMLFCVKTNK